VYINEYLQGHTLQLHYDHRTTYEEHISCNGAVDMVFTNSADPKDIRTIFIPKRSLYVCCTLLDIWNLLYIDCLIL